MSCLIIRLLRSKQNRCLGCLTILQSIYSSCGKRKRSLQDLLSGNTGFQLPISGTKQQDYLWRERPSVSEIRLIALTLMMDKRAIVSSLAAPCCWQQGQCRGPALMALCSRVVSLTSGNLAPLAELESRTGHMRKLPLTLGWAVIFAGYSDFLHLNTKG